LACAYETNVLSSYKFTLTGFFTSCFYDLIYLFNRSTKLVSHSISTGGKEAMRKSDHSPGLRILCMTVMKRHNYIFTYFTSYFKSWN